MESPQLKRVLFYTASKQGFVGLLRQPLYASAFFLWANAGMVALSGLVFWAVAARLYTTEEVGRGSAALSAITLLSMAAHLGLGMGLIRRLPSEIDPAQRSRLINFALTIGAAVGGAAGAIFLLGLPLWSPGLSYLRGDWLYVLAFVFLTGLATFVPILTMTFVALRRAHNVLIFGVIMQAARIGLPALFVHAGPFGIVAAAGLSTVAGMAVALLLLRKSERSYLPRPALSRSSMSSLLPFGLGNQGADLALWAPTLVLPLMVVSKLDAESAAHFYIGYFLGTLTLTGIQGLATSLFSEGSNDEKLLSKNSRHGLLGSVLIAGAGAVLILAAGDKLLLVFGRAYAEEASGLLRLAALAALPASITYTYLAVLRVKRKIRLLLSISWTVSLFSLGLSYLLLAPMGIVGAGVGILSGQSLGALICLGLWLLERQNSSDAKASARYWVPRGEAKVDERL